jgi:predicted dehydrogenase
VLDRGAAPVTPRQAITVMAVIEAAMQSAAEHRAVALALDADEREAWRAASN